MNVDVGCTEYRFKIEDGFARVRKFKNTDGSLYWVVTDTLGVKSYFGQSEASRLEPDGVGSGVVSWNLDYVIDKNDNYIIYEYVKYSFDIDSKEYIGPISINYTGNVAGNLSPTKNVKFYYELGSSEINPRC